VIVFCSNSTGWDERRRALVPGGMIDAYIAPVLEHLPKGSYGVARQPTPGAVNAYLATRGRYMQGRREVGRVGVQLSHGIADKAYRQGSKASTFGWMTSPGPAYTRRFVQGGYPRERIREVGYPKLDPIFQGKIPAPDRDGRIRVVWAPTHGGGGERYIRGNRLAPGAGATSWWHRREVISLLDRYDLNVVEAPHPRHRPDRRATLAEYVGADVVIADGGSTIYEAMALGIPVVLPAWITARRNLERDGGRSLEGRIYRERIGYHADRPDQLPELARRAAAEGPTAEQEAFIAAVLPPELRGHGGKLHAEFLLELDGGA
jgi:hypothetical protein